jgi:hypothetical protein
LAVLDGIDQLVALRAGGNTAYGRDGAWRPELQRPLSSRELVARRCPDAQASQIVLDHAPFALEIRKASRRILMASIPDLARRIVAGGGVPPDIAHLELPRLKMAELLTQTGRRTSVRVLATVATHCAGPPYRIWGRCALYRVGATFAWADARLKAPRAGRRAAALHQNTIAEGAEAA